MKISGSLALVALRLAVGTLASRSDRATRTLHTETCKAIEKVISSASQVFYPGSPSYDKDVSHWMTSSSQVASCTVEPGSAADVSQILQILAASDAAFGVKGGGHASNPNFSSTSGVLIAMYRFSEVDYDSGSNTATIGTGLIWDDVYAALEPHGVNVVGGRVTGVGVAGFTLGGGYSWLSNLHGLTIDTVTAFELVLPNGDIVTVTESAHPDLFFGLKGGYNNFGIVTKITLKTFPQPQVWGGTIIYTLDQFAPVTAATAAFSANNTDPNANIITTYDALAAVPIVSLLVFYNAPTPAAGLFDAFLAIPSLSKDISTRSFKSLVQSSPSNDTAGMRGRFQTVSLAEITPTILDVIVKQTLHYGTTGLLGLNIFVSYAVEPFLPNVAAQAISASAYPHTAHVLPLNLYFAWPLFTSDDLLKQAIIKSANEIRQAAIDEGQDIAGLPLYPNYAVDGTPMESIYGDNLVRLRSTKQQYDPQNVMGRAGGWKF